MCAIADHVNGSDSDTNIEDEDAPEYYQPISAIDDDDDDEDSERNNESDNENRRENGNGEAAEFQSERLSNDHYYASQAENGMSSLSLHNNDSDRNKSGSEDEEEEEEDDARIVITPDSAIMRAFREDENRRNAPLTPENATRVMEAMRGISFSGLAPDWVDRIPEERWIDQLRRLRQPP